MIKDVKDHDIVDLDIQYGKKDDYKPYGTIWDKKKKVWWVYGKNYKKHEEILKDLNPKLRDDLIRTTVKPVYETSIALEA